MNQTTQQRANSLWLDSAKIEVSLDSGSSYTDLGLARGVSLEETITSSNIQADNGETTEKFVVDHTGMLKFELLEFNLANLNKIRGGIDTLTNVAGTIVNNATQTVLSGDWGYNKFIKITNQNYNGGAITVDSVTGSVDGLLVASTDYYVGQNEHGEYGIFIIDSATVTTTAQNMVIQYDYTPIASEKLSTGGKTAISARWYKLTNAKDVTGTVKYRYIYIYSGKIGKGLIFAMNAGNQEDSSMVIPIEIEIKKDTTRTAGDQLFLIENEVI